MGRRVLILGGTAEARALATQLDDAGVAVVSSLAGRVAQPQLPGGPVRIGGFGGPGGLASYLRAEGISAVVDATHPFAAQMTTHAAQACAAERIPLLVLHRPAWEPADGDRWTVVPSLRSAAAAVPSLVGPGARVLLTIGRQGVAAFAALPQRFWVRSLEPPAGELPARFDLILERGPFSADDERNLLRELGIDLLVSKNSGGPMTSAKLQAARELEVPVLMIARPALPPGVRTVTSAAEAAAWVKGSGPLDTQGSDGATPRP